MDVSTLPGDLAVTPAAGHIALVRVPPPTPVAGTTAHDARPPRDIPVGTVVGSSRRVLFDEAAPGIVGYRLRHIDERGHPHFGATVLLVPEAAIRGEITDAPAPKPAPPTPPPAKPKRKAPAGESDAQAEARAAAEQAAAEALEAVRGGPSGTGRVSE